MTGCGTQAQFVKVRMGSWSYPEQAYTKFMGVPLYSGFMYAAVASYLCRSWRMFDVRIDCFPQRRMALVAMGIYANFISEYWIPDMRYLLLVLLIAATWRSRLRLTVGDSHYRVPLPPVLAFVGFLLWLAENASTYLGAWRYPYQVDQWHPVHLAKFGSWTLLVTVTFTLIALGHLHESALDRRSVISRGR